MPAVGLSPTTTTPRSLTALPTRSAAPGSRRLRCLPVPRSDPPFDDELPADDVPPSAGSPWWSTEPRGVGTRPPHSAAPVLTLPLPFPTPGALVEDGPAGPPSGALPDDGEPPDADDVDDAEAVREEAERAALTLPDPQRWATQLTQGILEVLAGERPSVQLARWTSPQVYDRLLAQTLQARADPGRSARRRPVVRSVRVTRPRLGVAEVTTTAVREGRLRAVALRLESTRAGWCCTALQLI